MQRRKETGKHNDKENERKKGKKKIRILNKGKKER